jgi:1-phosphatidylinositol-4-phosphate 5-kinase
VLQATSSPSLRSINAGKDSIPLSNFDAGRVGNTPANPMPFFQSGEDLGLSAQVIEGPSLYFMGIIDVLQEYNTSKKLEFFAKTSILCKDRNGVSCVEPDSYAPRFVKRLEEIIQACETGEDLENAEICEQRSRSVSFSAAAAAATSHHSQVQLDDV